MAFAIDLKSLDPELKRKISTTLTVKSKRTQYNPDPEIKNLFAVNRNEKAVYLPIRQHVNYVDRFPHSSEEYPRISLKFIHDLYTVDTDPMKKGRDQDVVIKKAVKQLDKHHTTFISANTGFGKCLAPGTMVLMFDGGKKKVEDITTGEFLMGDDSTPRTVLSTCSGREEMYEIVPDTGEPFTVNKSHILSLKATGQGRIQYNHNNSRGDYDVHWFDGEKCTLKSFASKEDAKVLSEKVSNMNVFDIEVQEYINLDDQCKHILKCYWNSVDYIEQSIPVDPRMLGVWLGDCTSSCSYFLSMIKGLDPSNKHIPLIYKANSRQVRLELLAGIIDTGGYYSDGCYEVTQKNKTLAHDIQDICRSLGFECFTSQSANKHEGAAECYYHTSFSGFRVGEIPVFLQCKLDEPPKKNLLVTGFKLVSKGEGEYHGFSIDGNKRFLLGSHMVTHNTTLGSYLMCHYGYKTVILCHNDPIKGQWRDEITKFTGGAAKIQMIQGKKEKYFHFHI